MNNRSIIVTVIGIFLLVMAGFGIAKTKEDESFSSYVDKDGKITRPTNFKENWTFLGSWTLPNNEDDGMHIVYTQPGVVEEYKRNGGEFPDGAVLIKEVRSIKSQAMTTGPKVIHAENEKLWFVMVKDKKNRFPDNPKWGDDWGWALYYADNPSKDVSTDYKKDCLGCHVPAKLTDLLYVEGYPVLKK